MASYISEHFVRSERAWDPELRPDGYVALCVAENARMGAELLSCLRQYGDPPPRVLGYDAMIGSVEFRTNLAAFMSRAILGRSVQAEQLAVVAGAGAVLELLFHALADAGEGVLVPTPSYAGFWPDLQTRDELHVVPVPRSSADDFSLSPAQLDAAIDAAGRPVRALLFTSPDNPLGRVTPRDELLAILDWADRRQVHVVFDEVYALSAFGAPFVSAASLRPSLGDRVHVVWAFSKDFGASGLRCGVLVSENEQVIAAVDQLAYWSACSGHTQWLLSQLVGDAPTVDDWVDRMRRDLASTHAAVTAALDRAEIPYVRSDAAFFMLCDLRGFLDAPTPEAEHRLWRRILDTTDVGLTPGSACRAPEPGFFRLCWAGVPLRAVEIAIDRLGRCLHA